jgi:hypothetical protein
MGAIKALLATGVNAPTEIAQLVKKQHGIDVSLDLVSQVKQLLKAEAKSAQAKKAKAAPVDAPVMPARTQAVPLQRPALSDKLISAIEFCAGVGGVAAAQALLDKIERIRKL